jgi:hypothetical protein
MRAQAQPIDISPSGSEPSPGGGAGRKRRSEEPSSPIGAKRQKVSVEKAVVTAKEREVRMPMEKENATPATSQAGAKGKDRAFPAMPLSLPSCSTTSSATLGFPATDHNIFAPISVTMKQNDLHSVSLG